jgi:DNA-binding transcriptional LysR family regulator
MSNIDDAHIRRLDMTLLVVFDGLMRLGKMSAVGVELGLTQSAVSHAVGRLREIFGDPLFVRRGSGVEPTVRARELHAPIGDALAAVRAAVRIGRGFDPATAARRFKVAAFDSVISAILSPLIETMTKAAPGCSVAFRTFGRADAERAVVDGVIDVAVGVFPSPPPATVAIKVGAETFKVVARKNHPGIVGPLDLDTYCSLDHVLVSPSGDARGTVDDVLDTIGRRRRVVAVMPQFLSALMAASKTDAIATAPARVCCKMGRLFDLAIHDPPVEIPGFEVSILTRRAAEGDPALAWFVDLVTAALTDAN